MILELQHRRPDGDVDTYHLKPGRRYHLGRGSNCEVRILDLKLSRKHAAIEFIDGCWQLIDLCSTNGCRLDGETMVGTVPLKFGHQIEIGQTILVVQQIVPRHGSAGLAQANSGYPSDEFQPADGPSGWPALFSRHPPQRVSEQASSEASGPDAAPPAMLEMPEPPRLLPAVVRRGPPSPIRPVTVQADLYGNLDDTVATVKPNAVVTPPPEVVTPHPSSPVSTPAQTVQASAIVPAAPSEDRSYFITVLGRRVGPLSRALARDLKSRELKGILKASELDNYPLG
jgi:hypothetical protein